MYLCEFCEKVPVGEPKMICDKCFEDEMRAQKRDEEHAEFWNEQYRIRYEKTAVLDNELGKISVLYHRRVLRTFNYSENDTLFNRSRKHTILEAKAYLEGWLDCIESVRIAVKKGSRK